MFDQRDLRSIVGRLLATQELAVLSTHANGQSYGNLVAFASTGDLGHLVFATCRATSKFRRLLAEPKVSLLVDNRSSGEADFQEGIAVTALGETRIADGPARASLVEFYLSRHPSLSTFVEEPDCVLLCVEVERYLVSGFREAAELRLQ